MAKKKQPKVSSLNVLGKEVEIKYVALDEAIAGRYWPGGGPIEMNLPTLDDEHTHTFTLAHEGCHGTLERNGMAQDMPLQMEHVIIDSILNFMFDNFDIKPRRKRKSKV